MNIKHIFEQLIEGENLDTPQMQSIMKQCMDGELSDAQLAAFLALMRMKGETVEELTAAALIMKEFAHTLSLGNDLVDIVGTGGDGRNTFNISTISSFVAAAAGANVAKHGNRSVSSQSGSADLLTEAGFSIELSDKALEECFKQCGIVFLFGPRFHQGLRHAREARGALKIRTLFNLLGPLLNPAEVKKQVVGVYAKSWLRPIATVLANLGSEHTMVIHSRDGLDEISIAEVTDVVEYKQGQFIEWSIDPKRYHLDHAHLDDILVHSPLESLNLAEQVFSGEKGPARDIVLLNSAAVLYCADLCTHFEEGIQLAKEAIDSGKAKARFNALKEHTNRNLNG
ncbi:anthranilate phosphoribosyltransferase [Legionella impletisoli]|uniref:Anthranilate phosphoribosyltransferase n=1 Tax=Legionella impletisoli TaxID=343510 RepID=A0A917NBJ4_9GAMM|nr:anthranilate phosphoribosyltransferase [Legionella impletisoli]GGI81010.1 anthranilate phosphoribosyltransferase [Legionella impletisoli]